ncbi:MAG: hypothetical protein E7672_08565 [Ruminococcaceae bacterium]|nr:hypothetical protein [Oscillospiraceae bacterium]
MKKTFALFLCMLLITSLVGCSSDKLLKPKTNLEFWIAENVENFDFSEYQEKFGLMGGRQYYGKGYTPTINENGEQIDPEECVIYTVTNYPDYTSRNSHITQIVITDPSVTVYGLTIHSSSGEIETVLKNHGFKSGRIGKREWVKGKFHIVFTEEAITISVDVSNFWRIQF